MITTVFSHAALKNGGDQRRPDYGAALSHAWGDPKSWAAPRLAPGRAGTNAPGRGAARQPPGITRNATGAQLGGTAVIMASAAGSAARRARQRAVPQNHLAGHRHDPGLIRSGIAEHQVRRHLAHPLEWQPDRGQR